MDNNLTTAAQKHGLTAKQLAFADAFLALRDVKGRNTQAAVKAGFAVKSAHVAASRMLKNAKVAAYVRERETAIVQHIESNQLVTQERIIKMLFDNYDKAMTAVEIMEYDGDAGRQVGTGVFKYDGKVAHACTVSLGKTIGMFSDKQKNSEERLPGLHIHMHTKEEAPKPVVDITPEKGNSFPRISLDLKSSGK